MSILDGIGHLPLRWLGLKHVPAVPVELEGLIETLRLLRKRAEEIEPARKGLSRKYRIHGIEATAEEFLYGANKSDPLRAALDKVATDPPKHALLAQMFHVVVEESGSSDTLDQTHPTKLPLTALSLAKPKQFSLSWTTYEGVYKSYKSLIDDYAETLRDVDKATAAFWPTIAEHGAAYNLLMLKKVSAADLGKLSVAFASAWSVEWEELARKQRLFLIDLSIFARFPSATVNGFPRFTPATMTLLEQDPKTKALTPIAIRVAGHDNSGVQYFSRAAATESAWLYALQAAKTSVTVYGIWLGHVYHWHIVSAAMQMTMFNTLHEKHPVYRLVAPQSKYLIAFDEALLLLWGGIAPPTSFDSRLGFLHLLDAFAEGRSYFDDDPVHELQANGVTEADFTRETSWDAFPTAGLMLEIWSATEHYVAAFVQNTYATDALVAEDRDLQAWIAAAGDKREGNIRGLPRVATRRALERVLASLIYRLTAHGISRLKPSAYPAQAFVANFPPCLQIASVPPPEKKIQPARLLQYLPKTGTIGEMMTFYTTFIFSPPYEPFIPGDGVDSELFFPDGMKDPRNRALVEYREAIAAVIRGYGPNDVQVDQWPRSIET